MEVLGRTFGCWTVLRHLPPAKRRPSDTGVRARVLARCTCGLEQPVWVQDLQRGRSGCISAECRAISMVSKYCVNAVDARARGASRDIREFAFLVKRDLQELPRIRREEREAFARSVLEEQLRGEGGVVPKRRRKTKAAGATSGRGSFPTRDGLRWGV